MLPESDIGRIIHLLEDDPTRIYPHDELYTELVGPGGMTGTALRWRLSQLASYRVIDMFLLATPGRLQMALGFRLPADGKPHEPELWRHVYRPHWRILKFHCFDVGEDPPTRFLPERLPHYVPQPIETWEMTNA
jgi:hypothetical protein